MLSNYWHKQGTEPLFPDLLWSRPENKRQAGKLLIIGGNVHSMSEPGFAYTNACQAGIGAVKVLLPDTLTKTVGTSLPDVYFAPSNRSGGFSTKALAEWLDYALWADAVLLAGDTARNSETAIVMERFLEKYNGKVVITKDCLDQFLVRPEKIMNRPDTLIVATFAQLQKIIARISRDPYQVIKYSNPLQKNIELLHQTSQKFEAHLITKHHDQLIVVADNQVSTTSNADAIWRTRASASAAVWWIQNPKQPFKAITTAISQLT